MLLGVFSLTGCNTFDQLFIGMEGSVAEPDSSLPIFQDFLDSEAGDILCKKLLSENDCSAIVVNNADVFCDAEQGGILYQWPEIDLNNKSLFICQVPVPSGVISNQRLVVRKDRIQFYYSTGLPPGAQAMPHVVQYQLRRGIYRKLPDFPIDLIWVNGSGECITFWSSDTIKN